MKKFLLAATASIAFTATPAMAAEAQPVESIRIAPSEAKVALAREAVDLMYPAGQTEYLVNYMMGPYADYILTTPMDQLAEDFGVRDTAMAFVDMLPMLAEAIGEEMPMDDELTPEQVNAMIDMGLAFVGDKTIQSFLVEEDEHFEERLTIVRDVLREEVGPIAAAYEGPMREALADIFAQKFSDAELSEIAAFADTAAGQKFAQTYLVAQFEPRFYGGVLQGVPGMVPMAIPMIEKITERTSHLPPLIPEPTPYCEDVPEGEEVEDCIEVEAAAEPVEEYTPEQQAEDLEASAAEYDKLAADLRAQAAELRAQ